MSWTGSMFWFTLAHFTMCTTTCTIILTKIINKHVIFLFTVNSQTLEYKTEWLVLELKSTSLHCQFDKVKYIKTQKAFPFPFSFLPPKKEGQQTSHQARQGVNATWMGQRECETGFSPFITCINRPISQNSYFHTLVGLERSITRQK